jgi:hypothetical protein
VHRAAQALHDRPGEADMTRTTRKTVDDRTPDRQAEAEPPGSRATQRGTESQLRDDRSGARPEEPTAWERTLQDELPPRGQGSQHNQGEDRQPETVGDAGDAAEDEGAAAEATTPAQAGGPRGPSTPPETRGR